MTATLLAASSGDILVWVVFVVTAALILGTGVAVVSYHDPFYSALALIGNLASLAVLFLLLSAEFVAAAQVLIYAGAIVVMFVFVIAYLGGRADTPWRGGLGLQTIAAIVAAGAILVELLVVIGVQAGSDLPDAATITSAFGSPAQIGELFLTDHLLAFELTSIVLLLAAVGGVILGTGTERSGERGED